MSYVLKKGVNMSKLKQNTVLDYLLENQQKEMRAYDQKAGFYITSNSGLFVIAIFTLCIFHLIHGSSGIDVNKMPVYQGSAWWALFIITILYIVLFLACSFCCFGVLFARVHKQNINSEYYINHSVTNSLSVNISNFDSDLQSTLDNLEKIQEAHIKTNIVILKKKHIYANMIPILSIIMGILLLVLTILLFIY